MRIFRQPSFLFLLILCTGCFNDRHHFYLGKNEKCDHVDKNALFKRATEAWPCRKPNSIADAILLLDSMADNNFRCGILRISDEDLYFTLALKIRNEWIRQGTARIKDECFRNIKFSSPEYASGLIIDIYRQVLSSKKIDLVAHYSKQKVHSSWQTVKDELNNIQKELGY